MDPVDYTGQENRITFQLYNYWYGLTENCTIPSLKTLSPQDIAPYKNNMVLIDLRNKDDEPTLQVIGQFLCQDIDHDLSHKGLSEIPRRTLLSRITDHYMEVLANRSPISFDAEFKNKAREKIFYRGILLPFSDDGENIDFILGAIRWITEEEKNTPKKSEVKPVIPAEETPPPEPASFTQESPKNPPLLADSLDACRALVQGQSPTHQRSRKSLYEALGSILDFYDLCCTSPDSYGQLLKDAELKAQKRAPFTPVLKLCFGRNYDKTRLTEYAAALAFAKKHNQNGSLLPDFLDHFPGGIKGCVQAQRAGLDEPPIEKNWATVDKMASIANFKLAKDDNDATDGRYFLLLARREGPHMDVIKILNNDKKILRGVLNRISKDQK